GTGPHINKIATEIRIALMLRLPNRIMELLLWFTRCSNSSTSGQGKQVRCPLRFVCFRSNPPQFLKRLVRPYNRIRPHTSCSFGVGEMERKTMENFIPREVYDMDDIPTFC